MKPSNGTPSLNTTRSSTLRTIDLARAVGLGVQQIRNYETVGFIPPAQRGSNNYRRYTADHLAALTTARTVIGGYGWQRGLAVMRAVHAGDVDGALALVNERHAELRRDRQRLEQTMAALQPTRAEGVTPIRVRNAGGLRVGDAARHVGVAVTAVRYWEQRGLLIPQRDRNSRYRRYDERQVRRLQVIVLLREAGYSVEAIMPVLDDLVAGRPERILEAAALRRTAIAVASRACAAATAAVWAYMQRTERIL